MRRQLLILAASVCLAGPSGAQAQSLTERIGAVEELMADGLTAAAEEAFRETYAELWAKGPLFLRHVALIDGPARGFADYDERASNIFKDGEPIRIYIEPAGYGYTAADNGFQIAFSIGVEIVSDSGTTLWGQKDLQRLDATASALTFEHFETLNFDFSGLPTGSYTLAATLTDRATEKSVEFEQAIVIE